MEEEEEAVVVVLLVLEEDEMLGSRISNQIKNDARESKNMWPEGSIPPTQAPPWDRHAAEVATAESVPVAAALALIVPGTGAQPPPVSTKTLSMSGRPKHHWENRNHQTVTAKKRRATVRFLVADAAEMPPTAGPPRRYKRVRAVTHTHPPCFTKTRLSRLRLLEKYEGPGGLITCTRLPSIAVSG